MTGVDKDERSAKERLQASREALVAQLSRPKKSSRANVALRHDGGPEHDQPVDDATYASSQEEPVTVRERALNIWTAAGVGAAVVVVKPWRLVSVGSLAVAALKSSQASSFVLSLITQSKKQP